jgi:hypothetical protein
LQVYTTQRADFSGGNIFGHELDKPTRTLLSFLINSVGGNYTDLICFIPVVTLNWTAQLQHFKNVATALDQIGFDVLLVITDGHRTNVRFFTELSEGDLKVRIQNPTSIERPLFLLFDPVHLMKNLFNNFQRKR